jgi:integrase
MKPNTLKEILGHSTLAMTMDLYAHVMDDTKQKEMNALNIAI